MLEQKQSLSLSLAPYLQKSLSFLQTSIIELIPLVNQELITNPFFEIPDTNYLEDNDFFVCKGKNFSQDGITDSWWEKIPKKPSLFENLFQEVSLSLTQDCDLFIASYILGSLDSSGFLSLPIEEIAILTKSSTEKVLDVLRIIQKCFPQGIAARTLKESLLIQLKASSKQKLIPFIEDHFEDLSKLNMKTISKKSKFSIKDLQEQILPSLKKLIFKPASIYHDNYNHALIPDIIISHNNNLEVEINDKVLPKLKLNSLYTNFNFEEGEDFCKQKMFEAKWLIKNIAKRTSTLKEISHTLIEKQKSFLLGKSSTPISMTIREFSKSLSYHETTITRAIKNKVLSCSKGLIPLKFFFNQNKNTISGKSIATNEIKQIISSLICSTKQTKSFSDQEITETLKLQGYSCSRRTVTKYRNEMNLLPSHLRPFSI